MANDTAYTTLPGLDGIPYRHLQGDETPAYRTGDPMSEQPALRRQIHSKVFDLSDQEQLDEYNSVLSRVVDSSAEFRLSTEKLEWDADGKKYIAFLRWEQRWLEKPKRRSGA